MHSCLHFHTIIWLFIYMDAQYIKILADTNESIFMLLLLIAQKWLMLKFDTILS